MPQQRHGKTGRPRRIGEKSARMLRPRPPARGGGAGRRPRFGLPVGANAQQKNGDAGIFRRPRQTQGGGKVERARRAENFDQRRPEAFAARRLDAGAQDRFRIPAARQRQGGGIDAEFGQSPAVQPSGLAFQKILPRPEERPPRRGAQGQSQTEAGGGGPVGAPGRMNLMQAGAAQAAAEKGVDRRRAQNEARSAIRRRRASVASPGDKAAQGGQGFGARRRSAPLRIDPMHDVFAQMFMLCSYQKPKSDASQAESSKQPQAPKSPARQKPDGAKGFVVGRERLSARAPLCWKKDQTPKPPDKCASAKARRRLTTSSRKLCTSIVRSSTRLS